MRGKEFAFYGANRLGMADQYLVGILLQHGVCLEVFQLLCHDIKQILNDLRGFSQLDTSITVLKEKDNSETEAEDMQ